MRVSLLLQDLFYEDPSVLLIDLHQDNVWPGSGALDETGAGATDVFQEGQEH